MIYNKKRGEGKRDGEEKERERKYTHLNSHN